MATCLDPACGLEMTDHVGCLATEYEIGGAMFSRIPYDGAANCHDCGTPNGELHHPGCDMERCPKCGGQFISCGDGDDGV